jgi:hypothetical protein
MLQEAFSEVGEEGAVEGNRNLSQEKTCLRSQMAVWGVNNLWHSSYVHQPSCLMKH